MRISISKIVLLSIFLLTGCNSFYQIDNNKLPEISNEDVIQIKFVNGETAIIDSIQNINITSNLELEIIQFSSTRHEIDSVRILYLLNKIEEIRLEKTNVPKSIFASFWITIGVVLAVGIAFALTGNTISFAQ